MSVSVLKCTFLKDECKTAKRDANVSDHCDDQRRGHRNEMTDDDGEKKEQNSTEQFDVELIDFQCVINEMVR